MERGKGSWSNSIQFPPLTLIRYVLYRLVHFFLELFLNTDALKQKKIEIIC